MVKYFAGLTLLMQAGLSVVQAATLPLQLQQGVAQFHLQTGNYLQAMLNFTSLAERETTLQGRQLALLQVGEVAAAWGMQETAGNVFSTLLNEARGEVRQKTEFALHRAYYREKQWQPLGSSLRAATRRRTLSEDEIYYLIETEIRQGNEASAIELLKKLPRDSRWQKFARFNIAVSQMKREPAVALKRMASLATSRKDASSHDIADQAALVLGYHYLNSKAYAKALDYLRMIRADGPYARKALLALGWAETSRGKPKQALSSWMPLAEMPADDTVVQEAMLGSAFTLNKLGAKQQAFDYYQLAINQYRNLDKGLIQATDLVSSRKYFLSLMEPGGLGDRGLSRKMVYYKDDPVYRFVMAWMQNPQFRQAMAGYRDVMSIRLLLEKRLQDLQAWTAQVRLQNHGERSSPRLDSNQLLTYQRQLSRLETRLESARKSDAFFAFHHQDELQRLKAVKTLFIASQQKMRGVKRREYIARLRRLRGLLLWQYSVEAKQREAQAVKELALLRAQVSGLDLDQRAGSKAGSPAELDLGRLKKSYEAALKNMAGIFSEVEDDTYQVAAQELGLSRGRLSFYESQARFALAQMFDQQGFANAN